jgi:hypothetical protein
MADGGTGATAAGGTNSGGSTTTGTGGSLAADCGTMVSGGYITEQYGLLRVTRNGLEYIVQNNVWGNASAVQRLFVTGTSYLVMQQTGDNGAAAAPVSYPSIFIGSNNGHTSANSGLPRAVNSLGTITTRMSHNAGASIAGVYNAAYDVWFSTTSAGDTGTRPSGGFLMVWLYDPPQKQPVGTNRWPGVSIGGASGTWDVWLGGSPPVISYVRTQAINSLTFDLNAFIRDAVQNRSGSIQNTWYLTNVFGGFEIWSGGTGLMLNCFYVEMA